MGKADHSEGATEEDFAEWKQSPLLTLCTHLNCEERAAEYELFLQVIEEKLSLDLIDFYYGEPVKPWEEKKATVPSSPIFPLVIRRVRKLFVDRLQLTSY
jgi:hypothetical protein